MLDSIKAWLSHELKSFLSDLVGTTIRDIEHRLLRSAVRILLILLAIVLGTGAAVLALHRLIPLDLTLGLAALAALIVALLLQ